MASLVYHRLDSEKDSLQAQGLLSDSNNAPDDRSYEDLPNTDREDWIPAPTKYEHARSWRRQIVISAAVLLATALAISAFLKYGDMMHRNEVLAAKPMLGWSSWNRFKCEVNESIIIESAKAIKAQGLLDLGYEYIAIDDCWQADERDPQTQAPLEHPVKFPSGFASLTSTLHDMGFKAGIYSSAGTQTCGRRFGSLGFEDIDAQAYAAWGFDLLKLDNCFNNDLEGTPQLSRDRYAVMAQALRKTGRPIWYYLCNWGHDSVQDWASEFAQSYRVTGDVGMNYDSFDETGYNLAIMLIADLTSSVIHKSKQGSWADMDSLEVGNDGLSTSEYRTQMSLWALAKSPLMLGHDPTNSTKDTLDIISNQAVLAVNQDELGKPGYRVWKREVSSGGALQLWKGELSGDAYVLLLINSTPSLQTVYIDLSDEFFSKNEVEGLKTLTASDLWHDGESVQIANGQLKLDVQSHDVTMLRLQA